MSIKLKFVGFLEQAALFFSVLFYVLFAWHQWWGGVSPRLIRGSPEREAIHHAHLNIGATLFFIALVVFVIWAIRPGSSFLDKLKKAFSNGAMTAISLFSIAVFWAMLTGLGQAWAKGEHTAVLGVFNLPHFLNWSWSTSGYMHSALSNISVALFSGIVFVYLYTHLSKYIKPGIAVALLIVLHLLINLPKPPSLHPIAAFGTYVLVPLYYFVALGIYCWAKDRKLVYWPIFGLFILFFLYLPYFAFKVLPPWHQPAAKQVVMVESQQEFAALRKRNEIFADAAALTAAKDTTTWCLQCHTVNRGDSHLLGPNLADVFNKQVASKSDYGRYSSALSAKGEAANFWTRDNLTEFLTNGQEFAPGNLMNQQTDLSDPLKLQQAIDYLEYISTE